MENASFPKRLLSRVIPHRLKRAFQARVFRAVNLRWHLGSGVHIEVLSPTDWSLYNDIFVEAEYDGAIQDVLRQTAARGTGTVLDLGANVGFFELRLIHLAAKAGLKPGQLRVVAVEPDVENVRELDRRLVACGAWKNDVTLVTGLAGKRTGEANLWKSHNHHSCTVIERRKYQGAQAVAAQYVDLTRVVPATGPFELLKCDIEGSEEEFVVNYGDLLSRVSVAVFEIHHGSSDAQTMRVLLHSAGLVHEEIVAEHETNSVHIFRREPSRPRTSV